ncbi:MAG TPA: Ig-like domain-containing protein, partial [Mycobacterium sp.]
MVAVGLAGCGDDVTVVDPPPPPPPPTPTVKSISVTPDGAQVGVGQTIVMSAAVVADAGVATTVTWSSSDPTKATVNAASGVVTGVAVGAVGIKATSTVDPAVSGNATLTVVAAPAVATISIAAVNNAAGAPVLLAGVAGQINVVLNLDRGGETVTGVDLLLCGQVVGSQNFAAPSADDADVQAVVEQISIPVNTAAFDPITGVPVCLNGPTTLSAVVRTAQNAQGTASPSLNLTLANPNTFAPTFALTGGFAPATSGAGLTWQRGGLSLSVLPVIYAPGGITFAAGSATFGTPGCDASGIGPRTVALV